MLSIASALLIILWLYAALTKMTDHDHFVATLSRSPLIGQYAAEIGWSLLVVEFVITIFLLFPKLQALGFYGSALLLLLFTGYILYMLRFVPHLPCSCGGVIQQLSWKQHIVFNSVFLFVSIIGIKTYKAIHL